ncbi:MAG: bifunctional 3-deoxy-7-phosphoheptulonate synthase/chorismate mutase type II [Flavobacteriia bacterium]|nr:bifunctional 3-deoxy-7-phosphoheptulonate synthase/chorismate mutase type II [Flavobacteriia bacterium]
MNLSLHILSSERPFLISGPCSVESEAQMNEVAHRLKTHTSTQVIRGGIWKPRTRPDSFEGVGEKGLKWLKEAGKQVNLKVCTEVSNAKHVEQCLKNEIDVLWIGARTTVNPFTVQEISDALKGTKIPILIKNPINPDLKLWMGAVDRFLNNDLTDITVIHRGFSIYSHHKYRNVPAWEIPIAFKQYFPEIPILCDPSHISGNRNLLLELSQKSMDMNFNGLFIETHPNPAEALSDASQQITPEELKTLINSLVLRENKIVSSHQNEMESYRNKIGLLDDRIFELLSSRMKLSEQLAVIKQKNNMTILQEKHWKSVFDYRLGKANEYDLSEEFVQKMMEFIHQESIRHQLSIMNPNIDSE